MPLIQTSIADTLTNSDSRLHIGQRSQTKPLSHGHSSSVHNGQLPPLGFVAATTMVTKPSEAYARAAKREAGIRGSGSPPTALWSLYWHLP